MQDYLNYIGGSWVASESKSHFIKLNPFNGEVLGNVSSSDAMDVIKALPFAKKSLQDFEKVTLLERAKLLRSLAQNLEDRSDEYALAEATHQGLPFAFVKENSILAAASFFRRAAEHCEEADQKQTLALSTGLVSIIASWCLSLRIISERLASALAAGNAVLIKVSEFSPITAVILAEICEKAQVPAGLVQIFQGTGSQVGSILSAHPSIRAVSFVGKTSTSESVVRASFANYKKIQVAAGAKNSVLILNETNFREKMPHILKSFMWGQGQMCWNSHRLFLPESLREDFMLSLRETMESQTPALDAKSDSLWMPVIEKSIVDKILDKSQLAQQEHAKIFYGSEKVDAGGFYVKPTFTLDLTNCSVLQQDELHGPLFIVTSVKYQHEMIKWANTGYYAHSSIIWGPDDKTRKPATSLQCAQVWTNGWLQSSDSIIGHKQSAFGNLEMHPFGSFFSDVKKVSAL